MKIRSSHLIPLIISAGLFSTAARAQFYAYCDGAGCLLSTATTLVGISTTVGVITPPASGKGDKKDGDKKDGDKKDGDKKDGDKKDGDKKDGDKKDGDKKDGDKKDGDKKDGDKKDGDKKDGDKKDGDKKDGDKKDGDKKDGDKKDGDKKDGDKKDSDKKDSDKKDGDKKDGDKAAELYLRQNALELAQDLATGNGPVIDELATGLRISTENKATFAEFLCKDRKELLALADAQKLDTPRAALFVKRMVDLMQADPALARDSAGRPRRTDEVLPGSSVRLGRVECPGRDPGRRARRPRNRGCPGGRRASARRAGLRVVGRTARVSREAPPRPRRTAGRRSPRAARPLRNGGRDQRAPRVARRPPHLPPLSLPGARGPPGAVPPGGPLRRESRAAVAPPCAGPRGDAPLG